MQLSVSLALIFSALAFGQVQPPQPPVPDVKPEDKCIVEGQVINAVTGEPVRKAQLLLRRTGTPGSPYAAVSDAGGKFNITDVDPGKYRLSVDRTGFVRQEYGARGNSAMGTTLTLATADKLSGMVFKLIPHGVIAGRVVDEDGDLVASVAVQPMQYRYLRGKKELIPVGSASSNDLGEYRLYGLRPGKYLLMAAYREGMGPNMVMSTASPAGNPAMPEEGYAPVYYPGALEPSGAAPLTLTPGMQLLNTDIRLVKTRTVRIRGKVVAPPGSSLQGAAVILTPRGSMMYFPGRPVASLRDPQGSFEMHGATPGSYVLAVNYSINGQRYQGGQPIDVGTSNIDNVQITLQPPISVAGHIRVEGTSDVHLNQVHAMLQATSFSGGGYETADAEGNLTFRNLAPDKYEVSISAPAGLYPKSVRFGDQDALASELDLSSGAAAGQIEIVLSPAGGQADGSVTNDKGESAAGATVTLVPEGSRRSSTMFLKMASTDQNGRFAFKDIAPGEYKVYAWAEIESGAAQDPDFVKPYEDKAKKLKIAENGRETLDLKLIETDPSSQQ